jgi:hypothetical protein
MSSGDRYTAATVNWEGLASLLGCSLEEVGDIRLPDTTLNPIPTPKPQDAIDPFPDYLLQLIRLDGRINRLIEERNELERKMVQECVHHSLSHDLNDKTCPFKKVGVQCHTKGTEEVCVYCNWCRMHLHLPKKIT